ncbi:MAG TPA: methyltransferase domain-containing protein [Fodinibius sp.]|nr:methyltransferase domain-containing protein [Fodinibius sp.]
MDGITIFNGVLSGGSSSPGEGGITTSKQCVMRLSENYSKCSVVFLMKQWLCILLIASSAATVACAQETEDSDWLIEVLEIDKGSVVAEIGAGDGSLTLAIAGHIGREGVMYSSELGADSVQYLRQVVASAPVSNVTVVEGHPERTNFPEGCCDALFMRRVYHHFKDPASMNNSIWEALKPGGRLAVIDFAPHGGESSAPTERAAGGGHGVTSETVVKELSQAGFIRVNSDQRSGRDVYVVMKKPEDP